MCKALDLVVNPQSGPESTADVAAQGSDALNKLFEHNNGQPKTATGDRNIDLLIDPDITRADYIPAIPVSSYHSLAYEHTAVHQKVPC